MDEINMDEIRLSEMDGTEESIAGQGEAEADHESYEFGIASVPAVSDMDDGSANANDVPKASEPQITAGQQDQVEKTMSARERRMAEPFDMPGAYVPGEQNAPSKYVPKQDSSPGIQNSPAGPGVRQGRNDDFLDRLYEERQQEYQQGEKKARILGLIVIAIAVFDFFSSISSKYADKIDKVIAVATLVIMAYCAWKFIKGSNSCRSTIGIFSLIDALRSIYAAVAVSQTINLLNSLLGSEINAAPYVFMAIIKAVAFGAMAYFFLLDPQVSEYTKED